MLTDLFILRAAFGVIIGFWVIMSTLKSILERTRNSENLIKGITSLPAAYNGMSLAHIGFGFCIIGITITSQYSSEIHTRMGPGDTVELSGYTFTLDNIRVLNGPNYQATEGIFTVSRGDRNITTLYSQKRFYPVAGDMMTEAGIGAGLFRDLYVSLGEQLEGEDWSVRIYHRPLVRWIWLGALFMSLGGIVAAMDRRYRYGRKRLKEGDVTLDSLSAETRS